jgi:hypothetical protein
VITLIFQEDIFIVLRLSRFIINLKDEVEFIEEEDLDEGELNMKWKNSGLHNKWWLRERVTTSA